jgi:predicted unusual protein kinase regulating ubiquinone biosynthesis (AarF/ABC1/UbiB family)
METTIKNDLQIVRNLARATPYARFVVPVLEEIEIKLGEEIDYYQEAENTTFFNENLKESHTVVPGVVPELSARAVLTTDYLEGISLDQWMALKPTQEERDRVAATLLNQFQKGLFDLRRVHADPNPGNFIVMESLDIGLIDFGCVKRFSDDFIQLFIETSRAIVDGSGERYLDYLKQMRVIRADIDPEVEGRIYEAFKKSSDWFCQLYQSDTFDFGENAGFILEGKRLMREMFQFRKYFQPNPEFVFLNRTNYGLIRIFEKLNARVRFINPHEWRLS